MIKRVGALYYPPLLIILSDRKIHMIKNEHLIILFAPGYMYPANSDNIWELINSQK